MSHTMLESQDLKLFSIHFWYEKFQSVALKTILIEIPPILLQKLQSDESDVNIEEICPHEFVTEVKNAINTLDKNVFVKNNWHAPMDAKMFSFGNQLKVTNLDDLSLFLSASNIISEDFSTQSSIPFYIALKPWKSIHPASEFRCIVVNKVLRGITPRDWPTYYAHFKDEGPVIIETLSNFYKENIADVFPKRHYTFDVIISFPDQPCIIDFGPLNSKTNLYAFSWKEISSLFDKEVPEEVAPIFRYLDSDIGIMSRTDAIYKFANAFT
ncbi:cell division cycle protein 123 homolog [Tribolium castaneum]|nr:PREDICTED: cell division cycle protein 123 homolog [Tribolium castaneum]|eukprot:XP_967295.2 PREDICTED: cell division cycle protein 123 homolog [Tribolium castaneum]